MDMREDRPSAQILQFPIEARRSAIQNAHRPTGARLPDFVEFARGSASYHDAAIREDAERPKPGH